MYDWLTRFCRTSTGNRSCIVEAKTNNQLIQHVGYASKGSIVVIGVASDGTWWIFDKDINFALQQATNGTFRSRLFSHANSMELFLCEISIITWTFRPDVSTCSCIPHKIDTTGLELLGINVNPSFCVCFHDWYFLNRFHLFSIVNN